MSNKKETVYNWETKGADMSLEELLRESVKALNEVPRQRLHSSIFPNISAIVSAIEGKLSYIKDCDITVIEQP